MRLALPGITAALLTGSALNARLPAQASGALSGTYQIALCKERPCNVGDTTNVVVSGTVVFADTVIDIATWGDTRRVARGAGGFIRGTLNGCLDLTTHRSAELTYVGIGSPGLFHWERESDTSAVAQMYQSPDAGARLRFSRQGDALIGGGVSSGYIGGPIRKADDIVVGRRLGDADPSICARAVARERAIEAIDPVFGRFVADFPVTLDPRRRYVIAFTDDSGRVNTPAAGYRISPASMTQVSLGFNFAEPGTTVLANPWNVSIDSLAGASLARIESLLARGVPADRITVLGVGWGAPVAAAVAARARIALDYAFIGRCVPAPPRPAVVPRRVLDVADSATAAAHRCGGGLVGTAIVRHDLAPSPTVMSRRSGDWGDLLKVWMR